MSIAPKVELPEEEEEHAYFPYGDNTCPACGNASLKVNPEDEYDIFCTHCETSFD